jgi:hypothetical protein
MCKAPAPSTVYVQTRRWDPGLDEDEFDPASGGAKEVSRVLWHRVMAVGRDAENNQPIHRHMVRPSLFRDGDPVTFMARIGRNTLTLKLYEEGEYHLVRPAGRRSDRLRRDRDYTIPLAELNDGWLLHCGPLDQPHRLLTFGYTQGAHA